MEVKSFLITFEKNLIRNGFSPESARKHTLKIAKTLKDADKNKIHAMNEDGAVIKLAENYSAKIKRLSGGGNGEDEKQNTATISKQFNSAIEQNDSPTVTDAPHKVDAEEEQDDVESVLKQERKTPSQIQSVKDDNASVNTVKTQTMDTVGKKKKKVELTERGKIEYRRWMMSNGVGLTFKTILSAIGSAIVYALIAVLICALIAVLVFVAALGCMGALAGLIYGVIKLFSVTPEGIYEIGLALVIAAVTLSLSIALYNLAVRITPILWKRFTQFVREKKDAVRERLNSVRTECNER